MSEDECRFPAGQKNIFRRLKNVRPFSCIKCSKLPRFSFDISLPQYVYPTQVNKMVTVQKLVLHLIDICSLFRRQYRDLQGGLGLWQGGLDLLQVGLDLWQSSLDLQQRDLEFVAGRKNNMWRLARR